ncbi:YtxH domain-containing protein [Psychrobacillus vulpis]|uniref:YtxH domain-containing protein n=1 Tax=Psychrobacillus vulpis TaxID=2325572 RepID=A0A544TNN2_9BACI|nr:YtxH domain-containing protein [Psychrobacillus vulpis]TQR19047.1 YtxH domain-containing protein [Psychrobacillus vulpis]
MKTTHFILGILTGAVVGASTVLLSTPQSGGEFRSTLKSTSLDVRDKVSDVKQQLQQLKNSITLLGKESKEVIPQTIDELKSSVAQWQNETAPIQEQLQAEITSIQQAVEELERTLPKPQKTFTE